MRNNGHYDPADSLVFIEGGKKKKKQGRDQWRLFDVRVCIKLRLRAGSSILPQGPWWDTALENLCPTCGLSVTSSQMLAHLDAFLIHYPQTVFALHTRVRKFSLMAANRKSFNSWEWRFASAIWHLYIKNRRKWGKEEPSFCGMLHRESDQVAGIKRRLSRRKSAANVTQNMQ